ncbi:GNAT family N-acetyltransferase [uncultured Kriegella sp.]|uniref:GNAT family N-acetyltransferase n=1 Tax=uncultured Kriegella sp. TaxID=1798910 RepID=UPI0030DC45EE|tara:strand:+ start:205279 stop:205698 length:420 start_codon:yes stop_codon:yes gene_type:complete
MYDIKLIDTAVIDDIIPLLQGLNPQISKTILKKRLAQMVLQGYQCVGVYDAQKLIGISGLWVLTKYYVGKHIEPDNVYIIPEYQGRGVGKLMMNWIFEYAKSINCEASELNCYVDNEAGRRFWEQHGYTAIGYHFQKKF